jgi:hypothetical protein
MPVPYGSASFGLNPNTHVTGYWHPPFTIAVTPELGLSDGHGCGVGVGINVGVGTGVAVGGGIGVAVVVALTTGEEAMVA